MSNEFEAKLLANDGLVLPAWDVLVEGTQLIRPDVLELDAAYFDTADLELARWGITLRLRRGELGPPWTLKLPEQSTASVLSREELRFVGGSEPVPADAVDLVRAFTRGRALSQVARLRTSRVRVVIADADGAPMIEIADDVVRVEADDAVLDHFREVEVEVVGDEATSRSAQNAAVARLIDAGCRAEPPLAKVVRALGTRAHLPPPVAVEPVGAGSSAIELVARLTASAVVPILRNDPWVRLGTDVEAVHQYRVATRRLRSDLRTFRPYLDGGTTDSIRAELAWLGAAVGPVRDLDVLAVRFAAHARALSPPDQPGAASVLVRVAAARREARDRLLLALRSGRYDALLASLVAIAAEPPVSMGQGVGPHVKGARPIARHAPRLVNHRWKQLDAAVTAAGPDPSDDDLHQIRIAAKKCRYAAEAVAPVIGRPARRFASAVEGVQTILGDLHDTVVAEAWLRAAAFDLIEGRVAIGGLIALEREERARDRAAWTVAWHRASRPKRRAWF